MFFFKRSLSLFAFSFGKKSHHFHVAIKFSIISNIKKSVN